jgi:DNA polymerase I-like protein with 3'-5' exonuclease and polymerase domains
MQEDYQSGDPYLAFGRRVGIAPPTATKRTHRELRDRLKVVCGLGAMYGAGAFTVASTLGVSECQARQWLQAHHEAYSTYWRWSDAVVDSALLTGSMRTCFGWTLHVTALTRPTTIRNFMMQAHGAEMLRLACCLATERGLQVCAPVHDALLVEGALDEIDEVVTRTQEAMREASEVVLLGFPLRTDTKVVRYPDRYVDDRGKKMWETVMSLLEELEAETEGQNVVTELP